MKHQRFRLGGKETRRFMPLISWRQEDRRTRRSSRIGTHQRLSLRSQSGLSHEVSSGHVLAYQRHPEASGSDPNTSGPRGDAQDGGDPPQWLFPVMGASSLALAHRRSRPLSDASNHFPQLSSIVLRRSALMMLAKNISREV